MSHSNLTWSFLDFALEFSCSYSFKSIQFFKCKFAIVTFYFQTFDSLLLLKFYQICCRLYIC